MSRLLVGNLDCELTWSGAGSLPLAVRRLIAAASTLLRVLGDDDDTIWTLEPVDPARMLAVPGIARPRLISGAVPHATSVLPWGALQEAPGSRLQAPGSRPSGSASLRDELWALPPASAALAARLNDRRFALAIADSLDAPGPCVITSLAELHAHLERGGAAASPTDSWVVKAPLTAAGRDRVRRRGRDLDAATRTRIDRLLARSGAVVFEPWLDRVVDLGVAGVVRAPDDWRLWPPHRLHADAAGGFRGVTIDDAAVAAATTAAERAEVVAGATACARALAAAGWRGPFVVDAFVHVDRAGARRVRAICELNARLTFGLLARAFAERLASPVTLRLGPTAPPGALPLLAPAADAPTAAWLEVDA